MSSDMHVSHSASVLKVGMSWMLRRLSTIDETAAALVLLYHFSSSFFLLVGELPSILNLSSYYLFLGFPLSSSVDDFSLAIFTTLLSVIQ
jgi:hypothetical protein